MRFQPGQSGNPAGRPPGSLNKKTLAIEAAMAEDAEEVVRSIGERAKNGEAAAMRLYLDRMLPTGLNRPLAIELPVIKTPDDAEAALAVVTGELAAGNLTINEFQPLSRRWTAWCGLGNACGSSGARAVTPPPTTPSCSIPLRRWLRSTIAKARRAAPRKRRRPPKSAMRPCILLLIRKLRPRRSGRGPQPDARTERGKERHHRCRSPPDRGGFGRRYRENVML